MAGKSLPKSRPLRRTLLLILAKPLGGSGGGMGGLGSGHFWKQRKSTVEESLTLAMSDLRGRIVDGMAQNLTWTASDGGKSSIGYRVADVGGVWVVTLHYRWNDRDDVEIPIVLRPTATHFGGRRWWFTCPLIVDGVACRRRVGKLHLPPGAKYFGCRTCHRLTYRSSQQAHQQERLAGTLARLLDCELDAAQLLADRWSGRG